MKTHATDPTTLLSLPALRAAESDILLVDDDPAMIRVMGRILSGLGQLHFATDGEAALRQARAHPPDLMLLDAEMPGMSGYQVCEAMRADPALSEIPVIFVTVHNGLAFELRGLDLGAVDFIAKPISEPLLVARVKTHLRMKYLTDELRRIATIDALTELCNRRCFDDALEREWKRRIRFKQPISLLMLDIDHFKLFNDRYGHPAGDICLRAVADALRVSSLRAADVVTRYGGEEFALLLPHTPRSGAQHIAHRVLDAVAAIGIPHEESPTAAHVTVSVGVSSYDEESACWDGSSTGSKGGSPSASDLVQAADTALYAAKDGGRAQAWRLDIDDGDDPALAIRIGPGPAA